MSFRVANRFNFGVLGRPHTCCRGGSVTCGHLGSIRGTPCNKRCALSATRGRAFMDCCLRSNSFLGVAGVALNCGVPLGDDGFIGGVQTCISTSGLFYVAKCSKLSPRVSGDSV